MAGKKHKVQGLRRRWLTGSMGPVLVILLLVGVLISVGFASNYYNSARSTLRAKAAAGADYFNTYVMTSYREYYRSATIYAAAFDDSDKIELQFLNSSGRVEVTTRGVTTGTYPSTPEILRALESGTVQDYIGRDSVTGERILAVSGLLKFNGQVVGVMRYVTAIGNIDRQVLLTVLLVAGVMLAVVGLIVMSSMIFINNVVAPVSAVSEAAKRISSGSYGVQIPNKYSDEMGELVDNINDMSRKIGESERMKSEFISSVSHELRTPVTVILGYSDLLSRWGRSDEEVLDEGISSIRSEAEDMQQLIEKLLFLARADQQRQVLHKENMELSELVGDVMRKMKLVTRTHSVELLENEDGVIFADQVTMRQMMRIFLENSTKYTPVGGHITARSRRTPDGKFMQMELADDGIGIAREDQQKVFDRFYRVDSSRTKAQGGVSGTGLGLSIASWIAEQHGIEISMESELGQGTKMILRIPLVHQKIRQNNE